MVYHQSAMLPSGKVGNIRRHFAVFVITLKAPLRDETINVAISMPGAIGKLHLINAVVMVSSIFGIEKILHGDAVCAISVAN